MFANSAIVVFATNLRVKLLCNKTKIKTNETICNNAFHKGYSIHQSYKCLSWVSILVNEPVPDKNKCIDLWVNIAQINLGIHTFRIVLTGGILPNNSKVAIGQTGCLLLSQVIAW